MNDPKSGKAPFLFPVRVRFADTDLQGHVFFANYFIYCDEGLMAYLDHIGYSVVVLDDGGHFKVVKREDGSGLMRVEIAQDNRFTGIKKGP